MDELVEGQKLVYVLSEQEAESMNLFIANHPDNQPVGTKAYSGQRLPATVILTRGPNNAGEERLTIRLDEPPLPARSYAAPMTSTRPRRVRSSETRSSPPSARAEPLPGPGTAVRLAPPELPAREATEPPHAGRARPRAPALSGFSLWLPLDANRLLASAGDVGSMNGCLTVLHLAWETERHL
jgi:hypothetical protein